MRYPRGNSATRADLPQSVGWPNVEPFASRELLSGSHLALLNFGPSLPQVVEAGARSGATVIDMRWVKPIDEDKIRALANTHDHLICIEDNVAAGGAGSAVLEFVSRESLDMSISRLAYEDIFIEHGRQVDQRALPIERLALPTVEPRQRPAVANEVRTPPLSLASTESDNKLPS